MSPRTGRPKAENPKVDRYIIRATADTSKKLDELSAHYGKSKAEIFRMGIERLYAEIKK
ncbi:MAG TPA: CopG family transcriptional regulator [Clostridiales bacterium]|jgi:predicted DNA-binding protein|nr:CopG family transcriptional regulator [Clostridiales bacterium]